jgi:hypothetical protein
MVSDADMIKHECCHALGALMAGATSVEIVLRERYAETIPHWPNGFCSDEQLLTALIAGRAHVVAGMSTFLDEDQIRAADPELVERIEAQVLPEIIDRLACLTEREVNEMLDTIREDGALLITPVVLH